MRKITAKYNTCPKLNFWLPNILLTPLRQRFLYFNVKQTQELKPTRDVSINTKVMSYNVPLMMPLPLLRIRCPYKTSADSRKPSMYNIELLEDSEIYSFKYSRLETLVYQFPIVERVGRLIVTSNYLLLDERMKLYAFCSAEERYDRLLHQLPDIFQRVSLKHIASYLGISQEHLSRIRGLYKKN